MKTSKITRIWRFLRLFLHLSLGLLEVALFFPRRDRAGRAKAINKWSRRMCDILHIRVESKGDVSALNQGQVLQVANHVSWIDIFVLDAVFVARFVAKSDVKNWPVIGWLCQRTGTLFVTRERRQDTHRVNQEIARALEHGDCIAVFPEGSTTDGFDVIPFNASLLQPAVDAGAQLAPVALRYYDAAGKRTDIASYVGEMSLIESIFRILSAPEIRVRVEYLPLVSTQGRHRREIARDVQAQIGSIVLSDSPVGQHASESSLTS